VRDPRKCIRISFVRCLFEAAYSKSCGSSGTGETPQALRAEDAHRPPRGSLSILERKSTSPQNMLVSNKVYENSIILETN
jgi:hypothetical protein